MISKQSQKELNLRIDQQKEIALTFQKLFASGDGKVVLSKISQMCKENEPTYVDQNPNGSAYHEGQRSIILGIRKLLNKTFNQPKQEKSEL